MKVGLSALITSDCHRRGWRALQAWASRGPGLCISETLSDLNVISYILETLKPLSRHDIKAGSYLIFSPENQKLIMQSRSLSYLFLTWQEVDWLKWINYVYNNFILLYLLTKSQTNNWKYCPKGAGWVETHSVPSLDLVVLFTCLIWRRKSFYLHLASISVTELQWFFMFLLLQVCLSPALYPVSGFQWNSISVKFKMTSTFPLKTDTFVSMGRFNFCET